MRKSIIIILLIPILSGLATSSRAERLYSDQHLELALRMIGHEFLLASGDSSSRVLPITQKEGQYRLRFENEFAFHPDDLVYITQKVLKDANIDGAYIVEMVQCETGDVVHAFEISNPVDSSMTPCKGRPVEKGCYDLLFTLNDDAQMNGAGELMTSPEKGNGKRNWLLFGLILVTTLIIALAARNRRKKPKDDNPNLIQLGDYLYDKINAHLIYQNERIELTGKEAELLMVLYESPNETIEREIILNKVWGDEGDYVGRTLDVFISKLRKKLESDSRLRIVNVRGVGYRFVMDVGGEQ